MSQPLAAGLERTITELHGPAGVRWLTALPGLLDAIAERWDLQIGPPFESLSYHYVAPATTRVGIDLVVKLGVPHVGLRREAEALRCLAGQGTARLIDSDLELGMLLLERLRPGHPLSALPDDQQATQQAAQVMRLLPIPVPATHPFRSVADRAGDLADLRRRFQGTSGPFPADLVDRAERLFAELLASQGPPMLLHGDLHHGNILAAQRRPWLAIDPKGIVGEAEYDAANLLCNPMPALLSWPDLSRVMVRRADQLGELLGFDAVRLLGWAQAHAVVSAWWVYDDHGRVGARWLACARALQAAHRPIRQPVPKGTDARKRQ